MSKTPFLSKEVRLKRVWKGFAIIFPVFIMILTITAIYYDLIDEALREYYVGENQNIDIPMEEIEDNKVLGEFSLPSDSPFYADEYIDTRIDERDGYSKLIRHIDEPSYYFKDGEVVTLKDTWLLKNGYELNLVCEEVDLKKVLPGDKLGCEIYYNGKLVVDDVNYEPWCSDFENFTDCHGEVSFAVFSRTYPIGSPEFLATSFFPTGFDSLVSIFNLENGKADRLFFETKEGEVYEEVGARMFMFELYGEQDNEGNLQTDINTIELVNYNWNPAFLGEGIGGMYNIWRIKDDYFVETKSITIVDSEYK